MVAVLRLNMLDDEVSEDDGEISVAVGPAPEGAYLMGDTATACTAVRDHELLVVTVLPVDAEIAEGEDAVLRIVRPVENGTQVGVPVRVSRHDKIMKVVTGAIADRPGDRRGVMSLLRLSRADDPAGHHERGRQHVDRSRQSRNLPIYNRCQRARSRGRRTRWVRVRPSCGAGESP